MPFVMLRRDWPRSFRRTVCETKRGKLVDRVIEFDPGVPVDLTANEVESLRSDIGVSLMPVELDEKARPRVITDEVDVAEEAEVVAEATH